RSATPMGMPNAVKILRNTLPDDTIVCVSAGLPQEIMAQLWIARRPRTFISSGGYSTMGFAFPAAIGAKLAQPDRLSVAVEGDGSFLMNNAELLTAVQLKLPVVVVVLNNLGWISIRDLQIRNFAGRIIGTDFKDKAGIVRTPDFESISKAFGAEYYRVESPGDLAKSVSLSTKLECPCVVEVMVENKFPQSGTKSYGFWDLPSRAK
ncbi:MAG: thiamine pyrophosphate-dependent enzyme, partial [Nitrososphaerales archaeon]